MKSVLVLGILLIGFTAFTQMNGGVYGKKVKINCQQSRLHSTEECILYNGFTGKIYGVSSDVVGGVNPTNYNMYIVDLDRTGDHISVYMDDVEILGANK